MRAKRVSDAVYLLSFFALIISAGSFFLLLPGAWLGGQGRPETLSPIDALFTATSAVCVTGLTVVDTAAFSRFGQLVILCLIQIGGLGIISFTSLLLIIPGRRLPFRRLKTIRGFSVAAIEHNPRRLVRDIVLFTLGIEFLGALVLRAAFAAAGSKEPWYDAVFHAISAFCNAGFSPYINSMEDYSREPAVLGSLALLIVLGGLGFVVLLDIERRLRGRRRALSYHTGLVLLASGFLIVVGALVYWLLEKDNAFTAMGPLDSISNAFFQAVTPRTAGFNAIPQSALSTSSKFLTILLMFVGGAPGSIAGGIKVSTAFLVLLAMVGRPDHRGDIAFGRRRLPKETIGTAVLYFLKAAALLALSAGALSFTEGLRGADFGHCVFESVSAFGTVGLSLGLTPLLSQAGKLVIIATMFAGRVGLVALAFPGAAESDRALVYPTADVLIG